MCNRWIQQQRPELPAITITWHASTGDMNTAGGKQNFTTTTDITHVTKGYNNRDLNYQQ